MTIEGCDRCGKPFKSRSEVERHKTYKHPVPVSPLEETFSSETSKTNNNIHNIRIAARQ